MSGRALMIYGTVALLSLSAGVAGTLVVVRSGKVPFKLAAEVPTEASRDVSAPDMPGMGRTSPEASATKGIYISPARQQLIGVRTATVQVRPLDSTIRTVGTLAYDERRVTNINTKIAGWVDRVFVDYVGKAVRQGETLLSLYSPALVATQTEYLLALKAWEQQPYDERFPEPQAGARSLLSATRDRLELWDISEAQIKRLERTGKVEKTLTLQAPFDGVVLERNVFAGQYINPEMTIFKLADLSTIWVIGQVFEYEMGRVAVGQTVEIEFPYGQTSRTLHGKITFIYPEVDPQTRRVKLRAEFTNPGFEFKPETYVTLVISSAGGKALAVPREAVIDTGARRYAILARPNGYFEPRDVSLGEPVDDVYPVIEGLHEGDQVVTSALFLVDSETNLKAAMQAMSMGMPGMDMGEGGGGMKGEGVSDPAATGSAAPADERGHSQHTVRPDDEGAAAH
ncbi:efflux RND transporter periplasmic adaptor subunit [Candidatus Binatia bacterium]|nr:efflux RND transporter periplasmic adaptor subunit [Candidatus Binatia bacterium]